MKWPLTFDNVTGMFYPLDSVWQRQIVPENNIMLNSFESVVKLFLASRTIYFCFDNVCCYLSH